MTAPVLVHYYPCDALGGWAQALADTVDDDEYADEPLDEASRALLHALDRFENPDEEMRTKPYHGDDPDERIPIGHVGGGRFKKLIDKFFEAISSWKKGEGPENPLEEFTLPQLRQIAKERGIPVRRRRAGEDEEVLTNELTNAILDQVREGGAGDKPAKAVKKAAPAAKKAPDQQSEVEEAIGRLPESDADFVRRVFDGRYRQSTSRPSVARQIRVHANAKRTLADDQWRRHPDDADVVEDRRRAHQVADQLDHVADLIYPRREPSAANKATPAAPKPRVPRTPAAAKKTRTVGWHPDDLSVGEPNDGVNYRPSGGPRGRREPVQYRVRSWSINLGGRSIGHVEQPEGSDFVTVTIGNRQVWQGRATDRAAWLGAATSEKNRQQVQAQLSGSHSAMKSHTTAVPGWLNYTPGFKTYGGSDGSVTVTNEGGSDRDSVGIREKLDRYAATLRERGWTVSDSEYSGSPALRVEAPAAKAASAVPRTPAKKAPARAVDLEQAARDRQASIDRARGYGEVLVEADRLIHDQASPQSLAHQLRSTARMHGIEGDLEPAIKAAEAGDTENVRVEIAKLTQREKVRQVGKAGQRLGFDPAKHSPIADSRIEPGARVEVVRPGWSYRTSDGEVVSVRPVVEAAPAGSRVPPAAGDATRTHLRGLVDAKPSSSRQLSGGSAGETLLLTYPDGAQAVEKVYGRQRQRSPLSAGEIKRKVDSEVLGARVLEALGVRSPATVQAGDDRLLIEHVDAPTWAEIVHGPASSRPWTVHGLAATDDGRRMGLADYLMQNLDRNDENWMVSDGRLVGLDHASAFAGNRIPPNPFTEYLADDMGLDLRDHVEMQGMDLREIRSALASLRSDFVGRERSEWFDAMMTRLDRVERRATSARKATKAVPAGSRAPRAAPAEIGAGSPVEGKLAAQLRQIAKAEGIPLPKQGTREELAQTIRDFRFKRARGGETAFATETGEFGAPSQGKAENLYGSQLTQLRPGDRVQRVNAAGRRTSEITTVREVLPSGAVVLADGSRVTPWGDDGLRAIPAESPAGSRAPRAAKDTGPAAVASVADTYVQAGVQVDPSDRDFAIAKAVDQADPSNPDDLREWVRRIRDDAQVQEQLGQMRVSNSPAGSYHAKRGEDDLARAERYRRAADALERLAGGPAAKEPPKLHGRDLGELVESAGLRGKSPRQLKAIAEHANVEDFPKGVTSADARRLFMLQSMMDYESRRGDAMRGVARLREASDELDLVGQRVDIDPSAGARNTYGTVTMVEGVPGSRGARFEVSVVGPDGRVEHLFLRRDQFTPGPAATKVANAPATGAAALDAPPLKLARVERGATPPTGVTPEMLRALDQYRGNAERFRAHLSGRHTSESAKGLVVSIDGAMGVSRLPRDIEVWRGLRTGQGIFGPRGSWPADLTGHEWTDPSYLSTATSRTEARKFARIGTGDGLMMRIVLPEGTGAIQISESRSRQQAGSVVVHESEIVAERDLTLRVVGDHGEVDGIRSIDVEVVPSSRATKVAKAAKIPDTKAWAAHLRGLREPSEIVDALDSEPALTAPRLRELASELNLDVPANSRTKADIQFYLAQQVARRPGGWPSTPRPTPVRPTSTFDPVDVAERISTLSTETDIRQALTGMNKAELRRVWREFSPGVGRPGDLGYTPSGYLPPELKTVDQIADYIARQIAADRGRWHWR